MKRGKGGGRSGLLPSSLRIISSCLKTVSSNAGSAVRSAGATVAASIAATEEGEKDQVIWAGFDRLELTPSTYKNVLLIGYSNGFQVVDVDDAGNVCELVSKRDGPVTFMRMQPVPHSDTDPTEGFRSAHPMLLVVAGDETNGSGTVQGGRLSALIRDNNNSNDAQQGNCISTPTVVRFYSLKSNSYVHVLRFRSAVYIVRCSPRIVAVALAAQIYCFDAVTLESKFSVLTYPLQGTIGVNIGYGPMSVGPRWLAYSTNSPLLSTTGRLSPQNLTPSPGASPSTSPGNGNLVARYAMESSKQLAAGIINLGDMGYKTISRYCQDLMPDGSNSPGGGSPGRRVGKVPSSVHPIEADNAGTVVIKDFISKEVISQFRAHTSPISALCFDPSGTLLVTASVHGHNINVFRILPTAVSNGVGGGTPRYDWASSHVHLYKLYRGLTAAVIQDFCFSSFSQWVAIVSSRGTCHIFTLSPFGGEASLQIESNYTTDRASLSPKLSRPWWANPSFLKDQQFYPPPPAVTLSVVSRIKNGNSGWLNTVSNVAATATGKASVPSGALAAVFHNSIFRESNSPKSKSLEHLLVYSPSGFVIQHELVPSGSAEPADISPRIAGPLQDDELHVSAEPVQWWDVCRRSNWPERDENISRVIFSRQNSFAGTDCNASECEESGDIYGSAPGITVNGGKGQERPHWYLSNAEVQINSGRIPIWQKSKICFYIVNLIGEGGVSGDSGGEIEIEKLAVQEIEIRRRELLPVFEQFHYTQQDGSDRALTGGRFQTVKENGVVKPTFLRSDSLNSPRSPRPLSETNGHLIPNPSKSIQSQTFASESEQATNTLSPINTAPQSHSLMDNNIISSNGNDNQDNTNNNNDNNDNGNGDEKSSVEFTQYFHEGYCKIGGELTDDSNSSHKEDQDNDDVIGGIFAFSEEG